MTQGPECESMFDLFKKAEGDYVPGVQGARGKEVGGEAKEVMGALKPFCVL